MVELKRNHRVESEIPSESFSEAARKLLLWQRDGFKMSVFNEEVNEGVNEVKRTFVAKEGHEDNPEKMVKILDFLSSKMNIDDGGKLRNMLSGTKSESSVPKLLTESRPEPSEVLRGLLKGKYDESIPNDIANGGKTHVLALYLYMHISGDSEKEMTDTLSQLIIQYDDSSLSRIEHGYIGLRTNPRLESLCMKAIESNDIRKEVRRRATKILDDMGYSERQEEELGRYNLELIMGLMKKKAHTHKNSIQPVSSILSAEYHHEPTM